MFDIMAAGEILIDFVNTGGLTFSGSVGGAPCNALAQAAKLGSRTAFIGMVGNDSFGRACAKQLEDLAIDHTYLAFTNHADTTLAFVSLDEQGDRDFSFYRRPGADTLLTVKNMPFDLLEKSRVYLYGGVSLSRDPTRAAIFYSLFKLAKAPVLKAFDPNLRPSLWEDLEEAKAQCQKAMGLCDILKISEEEACFFSGDSDAEKGAQKLKEDYKISLVLLTLGGKGCTVLFRDERFHLDALPCRVLDTTGAGDSFFGAFLHALLRNDFTDLSTLSSQQIQDATMVALAAASLTVSRPGSIPSLPDKKELAAYL